MGRYKARRSDRNAATFAVTAAEGKDGWRERVNAIVDANINVRVNGKTASNRTVEHNKSVIKCAFETWRDKLGFKISVPQNMQDRHVQALVQYWYDQGKAPTTMRGDLSVLRKFFGWMGKKGVVRPLEAYLPTAPKERTEIRNMRKKGNKSKSWSAQGIDVEQKLQEAFRLDWRFGLVIGMQLAFGHRRKETMRSRPWVSDRREIGQNVFVMHADDGTKGGRGRGIRLEFAFQVWILDYAKSRLGKQAWLGWPRTRRGEPASLEQNLERYKYYMKKLGISRQEVNATGHGARAEYAENCMLLQGFVPATLGGKANQMSRDEYRTRALRVSENLGHVRERITQDNYYGTPEEDDTEAGTEHEGMKPESDGNAPAPVATTLDDPQRATADLLAAAAGLEGALAAAGEAPKDFLDIAEGYYRTMPSKRERPDPAKPPVPGLGRFAAAKLGADMPKAADLRRVKARPSDDRQLRLPFRELLPTVPRVSKRKKSDPV